MPTFNFECFSALLLPFAWIFVWLPILAFLFRGLRAWKQEGLYFRKLYPARDRWTLATPLIVVVEMMAITAHGHATQVGLAPGFFYLFLALLPLTLYLRWRFRMCLAFAMRLCWAQIWLAFWVFLVALFSFMD